MAVNQQKELSCKDILHNRANGRGRAALVRNALPAHGNVKKPVSRNAKPPSSSSNSKLPGFYRRSGSGMRVGRGKRTVLLGAGASVSTLRGCFQKKEGRGLQENVPVKTPWDRSKTDAGGGHYDHKR